MESGKISSPQNIFLQLQRGCEAKIIQINIFICFQGIAIGYKGIVVVSIGIVKHANYNMGKCIIRIAVLMIFILAVKLLQLYCDPSCLYYGALIIAQLNIIQGLEVVYHDLFKIFSLVGLNSGITDERESFVPDLLTEILY